MAIKSGSRSIMVVILSAMLTIGIMLGYHYQQSISAASHAKPVILIDPGHGGSDPGKVSLDQIYEKDINLSIAKMLAVYLRANGYTVFLTRTSDILLADANASNKKTSDLKNRVQKAEELQAVLFISIHQNSYPDSSVRGAQCFYASGSEAGQKLATAIQNAFTNGLDTTNHRQAKVGDSYYVLKNSSCPAVIVECGFLSNPEEAALLTQKEYQEKLAFTIATAVTGYLN